MAQIDEKEKLEQRKESLNDGNTRCSISHVFVEKKSPQS
jgi:hypothetical protein